MNDVEPHITMIVSRNGITVDVQNGEKLIDSLQAECFAALANDVHEFAKFLVDRAFQGHEAHRCN